MRLVFDLEANGLRHEATKVWCLVAYDIDTDTEHTATDYSEIANILSQATEIIGHNVLNFDLPVLKKLGIYTPRPDQKITDTLVLSRLLNPDRKPPRGFTGKNGGHSLAAWGFRCGVSKPEHEDWSQYSPEMLHRCKEDVRINVRVYKHLMKREWGDWDWSFASYIEHEVARIITEQEDNGFAFNLPLAKQRVAELTNRIDELDSQIIKLLSLEVTNLGPVNRPFKKDGSYSKMAEDWLNGRFEGRPSSVYVPIICGPFTRIRFDKPELGSRQKLIKQLLRLGWEPDNFTDKGSPKLTVDGVPCPSLERVAKAEGKMIAERYILSHRRSQINGWIDLVREDGRIAAEAIPLGTNTGRMRHAKIVNVPKAAKQVTFGREMRELFTVTDGGDGDYTLCGYDADGLELRILGHHMCDMDFIRRLVDGKSEDGTDAHTYNQKICGLDYRDLAKLLIYALLFGAGDTKLGKIVGGTSKDGKRIRELLMAGLPALDKLIKRVKFQSKSGYLVGADGRKIFMRRNPVTGEILEHKALNTLIQCDGAIVMKLSMIYMNIMIRNRQLDVRKVIDQHDESQAEVHKKDLKTYMGLTNLCITKAEAKLKIRCPLKVSAKAGKTWADTH